MKGFLVAVIAAVVFHSFEGGAVVVPSTSCYALDNTSHIFDFSSLIGHVFEYDDKDRDLVVRLCKDVETRSQSEGYVDYGRFDKFNYFVAGTGHVNFVQEYYNGDLRNCEASYDKLGRTAQVNVICGKCTNGQCAGGLGCICNVTYESTCRVLVDLAIPCVKPGSRVFEGFTVGFHQRSWENCRVYNGMTQFGYEKAHSEYSFAMAQRDVTLYLTAVASLSDLVEKPTIKISPDKGLDVQLSGSASNGNPPTTLSPTMLHVEWICEKEHDKPYEVEITIPIKDYDPIQFTLAKMCDPLWHLPLFCCGGFIYKTRVANLQGLDALPGIAILSSCLETASGGIHGYTQPSDANNPFVNQSPWDQQQPNFTQGPTTARTNERTYGTI